jgi:uncharacterized MnhB-related membrane protein
MKLFLGFLFLSAICALLLRKRSDAVVTVAMLMLSVLVAFGYFFLNQI